MRSKSPGLALALAAVACFFFPNTRNYAQPPPARQLQQVAPIASWPSKAKRWALVIGVDQYADPQISPLKGAANDAHALTDALIRYAGFPQDQVILLATDQPVERQPTRLNILRRLSNLASLVPKDGLLLISFAGHGVERNGQAYLVPSDAQLSEDVSFLEESAVSVSRMHDRIRATGVAQVVILLDACRNDPGGRADAPNPLTQAYVKGFNFDVRNREVQAFATLYATAVGQRAYEYTEKRQGYFTWTIVEGLKGGAANEKGEVTLAQLIKYVQENVPKRVAIDLGAGKQQRPFSQMEGYKAEDLVIAVGGPPGSTTSTPAAPSVDPLAFELSYWATIKDSTRPDDFRSYLEKYPDGQFAALAKNKISILGNTGSASGAGGSGELAFWDSVKNSRNVEDFNAYLKKYPNGEFADLARIRINTLGYSGAGSSAAFDEILETHIRALGDRTAIENMSTLVLKGTVEVSAQGQKLSGTTERYFKFPDKAFVLINIPGAKLVQGSDGTTGWKDAGNGVASMSAWETAFQNRSNNLCTHITQIGQFKSYYKSFTVKGRQRIDNRDVEVVEAEPLSGRTETLYFDARTGLLYRWDVVSESDGADKGTTTQLYADEYTEIDGIKVLAAIHVVTPGITVASRFTDIKTNVPVDDHMFSATPTRNVTGVWNYSLGQLAIRADGTCTWDWSTLAHNDGTWSFVDAEQRVIKFTWKTGPSLSVTVSADGQRLEGTDSRGKPMIFTKR